MKLAFDHEPSAQELQEALKDVPAWPGSHKTLGTDYLEHVIALRQWDRASESHVYRPYVTVDGRVKMFMDAHTERGASYREELIVPKFYCATSEEIGRFLVIGIRITSELWGVREDMAVADTSLIGKDRSADATKPYENATTSARGRAIAAFGVGIIPTMGMASADEMLSAMATKDSIPNIETISPEEAEARLAEEAPKPQPKPKATKAKPKQSPKNTKASSNEDKHRQNFFKKALEIWGGDEASLVEAHRARRLAEANKELPEDWNEWELAEVVKLQTTAKEFKNE